MLDSAMRARSCETCMRSHVSAALPKAFASRTAISAEMADFSLTRLFRACRLTPRTRAPSVTVRPSGSRHSSRTIRPGWGGFFICMRISHFRIFYRLRRRVDLYRQAFAQDAECGFDLVKPGVVVQVKQAVHNRLGDAQAARQIHLTNAGGRELPVEFRLGGLQGRQADDSILPSADLALPRDFLAPLDQLIDYQSNGVHRHPGGFLFAVSLRDPPREIGEGDHKAAFFGVRFKQSVDG